MFPGQDAPCPGFHISIMLCLGIESSCDETALALVQDGSLVDSILASQADLHSLFGGVVPELASREHYRYIGPLFDRLLERSGVRPQEIDLIAVARGPGLLGSLLVGMAFAKGLALGLRKPLLGINHLHAHLLATGLENRLEFPALGLLASGGHSNLYLIESPAKFIELGRSLDDAAGEALDKIGHLLGLPYPAGKAIDDLARTGKPDNIKLPRPNIRNQNLNFSFSGLKTAAAACAKDLGLESSDAGKLSGEKRELLANFCAALNLAVTDSLTDKLIRVLKERAKNVRGIWLAGGVAANTLLRSRVQEIARAFDMPCLLPSPGFCTDNAAMIAYAAWLLRKEGFEHSLDLEAVARGRKIPEDMKRMP